MNNNKLWPPVLLLLCSCFLIFSALFLIDDRMKNVSGLCIGIAGSLFSFAAIWFFQYFFYKKNPGIKKQKEIEQKDERNILITEKAKAKAFQALIVLLICVSFLTILLKASLWVTLGTVCIYLTGIAFQIVYTAKYGKEI